MRFTIDPDRIAARYQQLLREQQQPVVQPAGVAGTWMAPQPQPGVFYQGAGADEPDAFYEPWLGDLDMLVEAEREADDRQDRYRAAWEEAFRPLVVVDPDAPPGTWYLETTTHVPAVESPPGDALESLRSWIRRRGQMKPPEQRRVEAGRDAYAAIASAAERTSPNGWPKDAAGTVAALTHLTGIPIVGNGDLPARMWRLVDGVSGDVLYEAMISPDLAEYLRVIHEAVDDLADEAGVPRYLLQ